MASGPSHLRRALWAAILVAILSGCGGGDDSTTQRDTDTAPTSNRTCEATTDPSPRLPRDIRAFGGEWYGSGDLYVVTQPRAWREPVRPDGSYEIKVSWFRRVAGDLSVTARRLDGDGLADTSTTSEGYPETGPLPTMVTVSGPGCWELTGRLGSSTTVAVLRVEERSGDS